MKRNLIELSIQNESKVLLKRNKMLLGSSPSCDIHLEGPQISHYHALIEIDEQMNLHITDLNSINGTYINGQIINEKSFAILGDTISFGGLHCDIFLSEEKFDYELVDIKPKEVKPEESIYIPKPVSADAILIDDEYCDIVFTETKEVKDVSLEADFTGYIDNESLLNTFPIIKRSNTLSILITTAVNNSIIEQKYFSINNTFINATNLKSTKNSMAIDIINEKKSSFIEIKDSSIHISDLAGFEINRKILNFDSNERIILKNGDFQVFIEMSDSPSELEPTPWFFREKDFLKDSGKVFACFLPLLLLLLVDITIEKEPEPVSIVYKVRTSTKKSPKNETQAGAKALKQEEIKKVAKQPKAKAQSKPKPTTKVAKAKPVKKAPVKAYEFKMKTNVNSMFENTKTVEVEASSSPSRSIASVNESSITKSLNKKGTGSGQALKGIGSGLANAKNDFGANGLSNKDGMDSSFIETETVVMGSIDPELLRKILQEYLPQFRHCYQQELSYNSEDIKGIVDLNFEISSKGSVQKIKVSAKDGRFSKKGTDCMGTVLGIINFPKPKGGGRVSVRQPLNFFAENAKG